MLDGETCIDRISALPDPILQHILSFLLVKDFIKTSLLSKRWRSVWAAVPILCFYCGLRESMQHFVMFVSATLANYSGNKVKTLKIRGFIFERKFSSQVDEWIHFTTERKVEDLSLDFTSKFPQYQNYDLPQSIYSNSSLRILYIRFCNLTPNVSVSWTSLQKLSFCNVQLTNDSLASILLGSPNLQRLKLLSMRQGLDKINITSANTTLKELVINCCAMSPTALEISAPHIRYLSLFGSTQGLMIKLTNLSSLMELNLDLHGAGYESLAGLVGELHQVQKLRVSSLFLEFLSTCPMQMVAFPYPYLKCQSLVVDSSIWEWDFHRIATLLHATPYLSQLKIVMDHSRRYRFDDKTEYWESLKTEVKCDHLTTVFITGFDESWCIGSRLKFFTSMVEFLLKNANVLEKMVIYAQPETTASIFGTTEQTDKGCKLPDLSEVNKLISSYPRASSVVLFKTYLD